MNEMVRKNGKGNEWQWKQQMGAGKPYGDKAKTQCTVRLLDQYTGNFTKANVPITYSPWQIQENGRVMAGASKRPRYLPR